MSGRGLGRTTLMVMDAIKARVDAGDRTPILDDVVIDLYNNEGLSLHVAESVVWGLMETVLRNLKETYGLVGTRVTDHYVVTYKGQTPDHPTTDDEVTHSVAGLNGRGSATVALHFCGRTDENCPLSVGRGRHGLKSGIGAEQAEVDRLQTEADNGLLDTEAIASLETEVPFTARPGLSALVGSKPAAAITTGKGGDDDA